MVQKKLTVAALKKELGEQGLRKNGNKAELRARLEEYLDKETVEREATTDAAAAPFQSECVQVKKFNKIQNFNEITIFHTFAFK